MADVDVDRGDITAAELQLATRNHGMPLEVLRDAITPLGLHYLLIHYDVPRVEADTWRLAVGGRVERELSLSLDELRERPAVTLAVTMECAGNGRAQLEPRPISQPWLIEAVGTAEWTGTPLRAVLEEAGLGDGATEVVFTGIDRGIEGGVEQPYERSVPLAEALSDQVILAYEVNGEPLPPQHGFPLRLVVPGWYGMTNVKWLRRVNVVTEPYSGYQQVTSYRFRQSKEEDGTPVTRMMPRALMVPPGIPDFMTRERFVEAGPVKLQGRAWSGWDSITRVEVSVGDDDWNEAELGDALSPTAWRAWSYEWHPDAPGRYELRCRATDAAGNSQPLEVPWNLGGYANNSAQRVVVNVT